MREVMRGVHSSYDGSRIPKIIYAKGATGWLERLADRPGFLVHVKQIVLT